MFDALNINEAYCIHVQYRNVLKADSTIFFLQVDNNAGNIYKRSWPLLEGWKEVFGKDRATGDGAEDVMETLNEFLHEINEDAAKEDNTTGAAHENVNNEGTQNKGKKIHIEEEDPSVCNSSKLGPVSSQSKRKRKVDDGTSNMCEVLGQIQRDMNARFDSLINKIGYHVDVARMRKEVYNLIKVIPQLSVTESFTACDKIIGKVERLEFFMGLPESDRPAYVMYVLGLDD